MALNKDGYSEVAPIQRAKKYVQILVRQVI